jgi:hypothetical protein
MTAPSLSLDDLRKYTATALSGRARLGYTTLLMASLGMATVCASLLIGEPALPVRTTVAFAVMLGIAICWSVFAVWTLTRRTVLLPVHDAVAARMAVVFSSLFLAGSGTLTVLGQGGASTSVSTAVGAVFVTIAVVFWRRATARLEALMARRRDLEYRRSQLST